MAIALVGSLGAVVDSVADTATPTFAQATTAGNLLVIWAGSTSGSGTLTSPGSTGWTTLANTGSTELCKIWYKPNCGASETAFAINSSGHLFSVMAAEFSGVATSTPVDQSSGGDSVGVTYPFVLTMAGTDASSGSLIVTATVDVEAKASAVTTTDTYNNATSAGVSNASTSNALHYRFAWGVTTSNASADSLSHNNNTMNPQDCYAAMLTFKVGAAPAAAVSRGRLHYPQLLPQ